jgi:hypothetical protein
MAVAIFKLLSLHLPGGTEEHHEKLQSGEQVREELQTQEPRIHNRSANRSTATFVVRMSTLHNT